MHPKDEEFWKLLVLAMIRSQVSTFDQICELADMFVLEKRKRLEAYAKEEYLRGIEMDKLMRGAK